MSYPMQVIPYTGVALTLSEERHGDAVIVANKSTGWVYTLPAATGSGCKFKIYVGTTIASSTGIISAAGTDIIQGAVTLTSDAAGVTVPCTATTDLISMSGTTTGGVKGSYVELVDVASGQWLVSGALVSVGAEVTPFSGT